MTTTLAPNPSVPRETRYAAVEAAYGALRMAQVLHGDMSAAARQARRQISRAWMQYECSAAVGRPAKPIITHHPLVGETEIELAVDLDDVAYQLTLTLDGQGSDAAGVVIDPAPDARTGVPLVTFAALGTLAALEAAAASRGDTRSADTWSRAHVGLNAWCAGYLQARAADVA